MISVQPREGGPLDKPNLLHINRKSTVVPFLISTAYKFKFEIRNCERIFFLTFFSLSHHEKPRWGRHQVAVQKLSLPSSPPSILFRLEIINPSLNPPRVVINASQTSAYSHQIRYLHVSFIQRE